LRFAERVRSEELGSLLPLTFGVLARAVMSERFGASLASERLHIVGDAKYFTLVHGQRLPLAKFSVIAEHVWLLEKTGAPATFLVFGNDRQVPELWLQRYGNLVAGVAFYFLTDWGDLEQLSSGQNG
jgi:hypothetical protein